MATSLSLTEADILEKVVSPTTVGQSFDAARDFLKFRFDPKATAQIRRLLQKNNRGTITAEERVLLEKYLRVGQFLDLLHAKARVVLRDANLTS
jgi:(p)ppGpp synthase/HD superfamily hydrolase